MLIEFQQHASINNLQRAAVDLGKLGEFASAHETLGAARQLAIEPAAELSESSRGMHLGRLDRDEAFAYAREAIQKNRPQLLEHGHAVILGSQSGTDSLLSLGEHSFEPAAWSYLQSEHGATLATLFRLAVINRVLFSASVALLPPSFYLDEAWQYLSQGQNHYYQTSHAIHVARYERIMGHQLEAAHWLGRGALALIDTPRNDPSNSRRALATFINHLPDFRTTRASLRSVSTKP